MKLSNYVICVYVVLCGIFTNACSNMNTRPSLKKEIVEQCWGHQPNSRILEEYPINSELNVLTPSNVRAYGVGRYSDPMDPNVMHERHIVYRLEQEPRWRYNVDASKQILIGNTIADSRCTYQPALLDKEIALELQKQRVINKNLQLTYKKMLDLYEKIEETHIQFLKHFDKLNQISDGGNSKENIHENENPSDKNRIIVNTPKL